MSYLNSKEVITVVTSKVGLRSRPIFTKLVIRDIATNRQEGLKSTVISDRPKVRSGPFCPPLLLRLCKGRNLRIAAVGADRV